MNEGLIEKIKACPTLPSLPAVAIQVLDLAQREEVDIAEIARVISKDPALSSKILRTVNSSFYGRSQSISTITHALVILGLQSVKTLVLGFSLVTNLKQCKGKGFNYLLYWRRSIYAATAARTIAAKIGLVQQEECFLASLLMDMGMLVLDQVVGEQYGEVVGAVTSHNDLPAAEQQALDLGHADAVGVLMEQWKLPPLLTTPMIRHHDPKSVEDASLRKITEVVYLAGRCADVFVDEAPADAIADVRRFCMETYKLEASAGDVMLDSICTRTKEVASLFEIRIASGTNYDAILKKANEALVDLTLRSQRQATSLKELNTQLKQAATTDKLTGLANRGRFDEFLAEAVASASDNAVPVSMLLLDVDRFKSVNDTHGHQVGDQVLMMLGALLGKAARPHDLAARYGGEELAIVMPNTSRAAAAQTAEVIRKAIAARPLKCGAVQLPVTASIGVATLEPGGALKIAAHLIKAADMAVYAAKHQGRNCVRVFALKPAA